MNRMSEQKIWVRPFIRRDRTFVFNLLSFLPAYYPNSLSWLERRLDQVEDRKAFCTVAGKGTRLEGILIDTPKGRRETKISTFFVRNETQRLGIGNALLLHARQEWSLRGVDNAYVTVPATRRIGIENFLLQKKFARIALLPEYYGPERDEFVYSTEL